jgi:hypothetical protein
MAVLLTKEGSNVMDDRFFLRQEDIPEKKKKIK